MKIDDFPLLWFIIYFFSFLCVRGKSSVILRYEFKRRKKKDCITFHVLYKYSILYLCIMQWYDIKWNMNHIQFRSVIRSNFVRSMKLYGCTHTTHSIYGIFGMCYRDKQKKYSHWEWKREKREISSHSVIRIYIFLYIYGFNLLRAVFLLFSIK